jgi:hypothetical protein
MSTSVSPRSSGPSDHPTRQQLDELDALLQRMLALPVNKAGDDVAAEIDATPQPAPVSYRTPDYREDEAHVEADKRDENWVPLSSTWTPSPHTWKPLAQSWQQPRPQNSAQDSPPAAEEPVIAPVPPPPPRTAALPSPAPEAPRTAPAPAASVPATAAWVRPLVWFNDGFDLGLRRCGKVGGWLQRDSGRLAVGAAGVLFLAAAVVLGVAAWLGWT